MTKRAMMRLLVSAAILSAIPPAAAWGQYATPRGTELYAQRDGQGRQSSGRRPGRDRQEAQRGQDDRDSTHAMTPDERRELNRDLQRANREFYRKGRREGR